MYKSNKVSTLIQLAVSVSMLELVLLINKISSVNYLIKINLSNLANLETKYKVNCKKFIELLYIKRSKTQSNKIEDLVSLTLRHIIGLSIMKD